MLIGVIISLSLSALLLILSLSFKVAGKLHLLRWLENFG